LLIKEVTPADAPMVLLLEADPSIEKVNEYVRESRCFVATVDAAVIGVYVVRKTASDAYELMNISVAQSHQKKGIGTELLKHAIALVRELRARCLTVGTVSFGYYLTFYQRAGFRVISIDKDFFLKNYTEPMYENGIQLKDMLRLAIQYRD
jgi:GNAT superfamily N-acetyltransferase